MSNLTDEVITAWSQKMDKFNYADVKRLVADLVRNVLAGGYASINGVDIPKILSKIIKQIKVQYRLCKQIEMANSDNKMYESYIS
jgi:hypothetical protein